MLKDIIVQKSWKCMVDNNNYVHKPNSIRCREEVAQLLFSAMY